MSGASIFIKDDLHISDTQIEILAGIMQRRLLLPQSLAVAAGRSLRLDRQTLHTSSSPPPSSSQALFPWGARPTTTPSSWSAGFVAGIGVGYALMIAPSNNRRGGPRLLRGFLTLIPGGAVPAGVPLAAGVMAMRSHRDG
ncbi:uncharacterized protein A4U43_C08F11430 [Asparagus officinalis]|nr:uncharacterized protein A4U43_C08F11430 [Asparagus officinalis]